VKFRLVAEIQNASSERWPLFQYANRRRSEFAFEL